MLKPKHFINPSIKVLTVGLRLLLCWIFSIVEIQVLTRYSQQVCVNINILGAAMINFPIDSMSTMS